MATSMAVPPPELALEYTLPTGSELEESTVARLPENTRNEDNKDAYDYLQKTRGAVRGGFAITLLSPDITQRMAHVGSYVRFDSPLPKLITELAATAISAELENPAEVAPHSKNCRDLKVTPALLDAVLAR